MSDIELEDEEACSWFVKNQPAASPEPGRFGNLFRKRRPRLHLLVGDSVARRASLGSRFAGDQVLNRARGGETWSSLMQHLDTTVVSWQTVAAAEQLLPGTLIIWLTGNEAYSRLSWLSNFDRELLDTVGRTATAVIFKSRRLAEEVLVLGPLPRLAGEIAEASWESTAAFHLERTLLKLEVKFQFITLGRALTRKMGRNRHGLRGCETWFHTDGVHLSAAGYMKLADAAALPVWLVLGAASG